MKHYFIINPKAGAKDTSELIQRRIESFQEWTGEDWEAYVTSAPGDAANYTAYVCQDHPDTPMRFYACGGDGTLNEVLSGAMGHANAQLALYPSGSGNDFLRCFGAKGDFLDFERLAEGTPTPTDVMRITVGQGPDAPVRYCINVCGLGFDAYVGRNMQRIKRWPIVGGKRSYVSSLVASFLFHRRSRCTVMVDGELFLDNAPFLFCTVNNGRYEGGGFCGAPNAMTDDGLLDIFRIKPVPILRFPSLVKLYHDGRHVDSPSAQDIFEFRQGTEVDITCRRPMPCVIDGEILLSDHYHVELLPKAIDFIIPKGL